MVIKVNKTCVCGLSIAGILLISACAPVRPSLAFQKTNFYQVQDGEIVAQIVRDSPDDGLAPAGQSMSGDITSEDLQIGATLPESSGDKMASAEPMATSETQVVVSQTTVASAGEPDVVVTEAVAAPIEVAPQTATKSGGVSIPERMFSFFNPPKVAVEPATEETGTAVAVSAATEVPEVRPTGQTVTVSTPESMLAATKPVAIVASEGEPTAVVVEQAAGAAPVAATADVSESAAQVTVNSGTGVGILEAMFLNYKLPVFSVTPAQVKLPQVEVAETKVETVSQPPRKISSFFSSGSSSSNIGDEIADREIQNLLNLSN